MGDEIKIKETPPPSQPAGDQFGVSADYTLGVSLGTSISEGGGINHTPALQLHYAPTFNDTYQLRLQFPIGSTETRIVPTTGAEGTTAEHKHWAAMIGFGPVRRSFPAFGSEGDFVAALNVATIPMIGYGSSSITAPDRTLGNETFEFGTQKSATFDIGTRYTFAGELRPGGSQFPTFTIGTGFYYGSQYAGDEKSSAFPMGRLRLDLLFTVGIGFGDASATPGTDADTELDAAGIVSGFYALGHGFAQRALFAKMVTQPMQALDEYGLLGNDANATNRGSLADVPLLQAAAVFSGGMGSPLATPLRGGEAVCWTYGSAQAIGGIAFVAASDSTEARAAGVSDIMSFARLGSYAIAGINTPDKRLALDSPDVGRRQGWVNFAHFLAGSALTLIGGAAGSDIAMKGGSMGNTSIALSPDPIENGMARTEVSWAPYAFYAGNNRSGWRSGLVVQNDFPELPLSMTAFFLSPMLTFGNIGNMPSQDEAYTDAMLPTTIGASLNLSKTWTWARLSLGLLTSGNFGSSEQKAGVGGIAGADVILPFNGKEDGSGITFGVRGSAEKTFPAGAQYQVIPSVGITFGGAPKF